MKSFRRSIDRFCQKHRNFGVPRLMLYIVIATAIVFILGTLDLISVLMFRPDLILQGQVWRLITWIFIPLNLGGGFANMFFTAIALYFYYFIGSTLEREWGVPKFTIYYIFGILLHIIFGFIMYLAFGTIVYIVPMFLNLSMFFAFAALFPEFTVRLFLVLPIKIKWLALANAVLFLYEIIAGLIYASQLGEYFSALMPLIALLNFFLICGDELLIYLRPLKAKTSPRVINFKKAAKQAKRDLADKPYRHKCAVCGKTDVDYPNMDFRYCSQCDGYHCFCSEHINNHIHFK
ncbi:MAG: hypothetical protein LBC73_02015 [Oscillospiraceae bacterium]|nr:hypothetical protein [Oscillospiraceae bacterium]